MSQQLLKYFGTVTSKNGQIMLSNMDIDTMEDNILYIYSWR